MAHKDARIRFLERELAEREKEVESLKEAERTAVSGADDERLRELAQKVNELEALVKGLTEELLDVKSVVMELNRQAEERVKGVLEAEPRKNQVQTTIEPRAVQARRSGGVPHPGRADALKAGEPAQKQADARADAGDGGEMDLIMQNDGTLKPERRKPSEYIVASTKFESRVMGGRKAESPGRTAFVEQRKGRRSVGSIIHAEEDDTTDIANQ